MNPNITIVVNTSDPYEDCWIPFFKLLSIYWPDCKYPLILNTELKTFSFPGINIISSRVAQEEPSKRPTWSECLIRCLNSIDTELILYLQEDYFLNDYVNTEQLEEAISLMLDNGWTNIRLQGTRGTGVLTPTPYPWLWRVEQNARYRLSLQASLWNRKGLLRYLRRHETAWEFELLGSKRAARIDDTIFLIKDRKIFPYTPTGVVSGKWKPAAVVDLFQQHDIHVDFGKRGFFDPNVPQPRTSSLRRLIRRIRSLV